ncbi:MAG TPA: trehalose-phosphatase [Gemmatimonadaceae bacterium]|nr:trehalose-phosphatase [Gemmatimonadaceae bacterium]
MGGRLKTAGLSKAVETLVEAAGARLDGSPLGVFLDIDGTLAPIASRPEDAGVPPTTLAVLRRLVDLPQTSVALVTGRSAENALEMVDVAGTWIIGNHGLELRSPDGVLTAMPEVAAYEGAVAKARAELEAAIVSIPGAFVENKRWSLSVHYRLSDPSFVPYVKEAAQRVAREMRLRTLDGKMVVELRPPLDTNKGTASVALAQRITADRNGASLINAGDDRTDEDAFEALRAFNKDAVTIRVGDGERVPVPTHAEFTLDSPDELRQLLEWLVARRGRD